MLGSRAIAVRRAALDGSRDGLLPVPNTEKSLAGLKDAPALESLSFDLTRCQIGAAGVMALGPLGDAARLHSLRLTLAGNELGATPARDAFAGLAAGLQRARRLTALSLDLAEPRAGQAPVAAPAAALAGPDPEQERDRGGGRGGPRGAGGMPPAGGAPARPDGQPPRRIFILFSPHCHMLGLQ